MVYPSYFSNVENVGRTTNTIFSNFFDIVHGHNDMKEKDTKRLKKFAAQLTKLRKKKGLSQRELSSRCDVDYGKISKLENNKANLTLTTLIELAEGLEIHPKDLLDINFD
jgi:DNA-binding Xre family transcriptional regulator